MLRFFRQIRQRLLTDNKFSRYLLYAVGEILLVVIGILIALQINNWNDEQKLKAKEIKIYTEIRHELAAAILDIKNDLQDHRRNQLSNTVVINTILQKTEYSDTLLYHLALTTDWEQLTLTTSGFESLKSIGFDILENDSIRRAITDLYQGKLPDIVERDKENGLSSWIIEKTEPEILSHQVLNPDIINKDHIPRGYQYKIKNYKAFLNDEPLLLSLHRTHRKRWWLIRNYERLTTIIEEIVKKIDEELGK